MTFQSKKMDKTQRLGCSQDWLHIQTAKFVIWLMCQMVSDMMRQIGQYQRLVAILSLIEKCKPKMYTDEFAEY